MPYIPTDEDIANTPNPQPAPQPAFKGYIPTDDDIAQTNKAVSPTVKPQGAPIAAPADTSPFGLQRTLALNTLNQAGVSPKITSQLGNMFGGADIAEGAVSDYQKTHPVAPPKPQPLQWSGKEDHYNANDPNGPIATFEKQPSNGIVRTVIPIGNGQNVTRVVVHGPHGDRVHVFGPDGSASQPDGTPWTVPGQESQGHIGSRQLQANLGLNFNPADYGQATREAIDANPVKVAANAIASNVTSQLEESKSNFNKARQRYVPGAKPIASPVDNRLAEGAGNVVSGAIMGGPQMLQYIQDNAMALAGNKAAQQSVDTDTQANINAAGAGPGGQLEALKAGNPKLAAQITLDTIKAKPIEAGATILMLAGFAHAGVKMAPEVMATSLDTVADMRSNAARAAAESGDRATAAQESKASTQARAAAYAIRNMKGPRSLAVPPKPLPITQTTSETPLEAQASQTEPNAYGLGSQAVQVAPHPNSVEGMIQNSKDAVAALSSGELPAPTTPEEVQARWPIEPNPNDPVEQGRQAVKNLDDSLAKAKAMGEEADRLQREYDEKVGANQFGDYKNPAKEGQEAIAPAAAPVSEPAAAPPVRTKPVLTPINGSASFREALKKHFGLSDEKANANSTIADLRANAWAKATGNDPSEWYKTRIAAVGKGGPNGEGLNQSGAGSSLSAAEQSEMSNLIDIPWRERTMDQQMRLKDLSEGNPARNDYPMPYEYRDIPSYQDAANAITDVAIGINDAVKDTKYSGIGNLIEESLDDPDAIDTPTKEVVQALKDYAYPDIEKDVPDIEGHIEDMRHAVRRSMQAQDFEESGIIDANPARDYHVVDEHGNIIGTSYDEQTAKAFARYLEDYHSTPDHEQFNVEHRDLGELYDQRQGPARGSITFLNDNRAVIRALTDPDVSTPAHELFHVFRRDMYREGGLDAKTIKAVEDWAGAKNGRWTRAAEEKFARGGERYLAEGKADWAPEAVRKVFEQFKQWLTAIYDGIKGSEIDKQLTPEVRDAFERLLGKTDEAVKGAADTPAKEKYIAGSSLNRERLSLSPEAEKNVADAAKRLGLSDKPVATDAEAHELAKSLKLSYDDLKDWPVGDVPAKPEGVPIKTWQKAWRMAVRDLHTQAQNELVSAQRANTEAQDAFANWGGTLEQKTAADQASVNHARAMANVDTMADHDDALSAGSGAALQSYNRQSQPMESGEGNPYIAKIKAAVQARNEAQAETKSAGNAKTSEPRKPGAAKNAPPKPQTLKRTAKVAEQRTVTPEDLKRAVDEFKARQEEAKTLHQSDDPLTTIGRYHYEDGLRGANWRKAVEQSIGEPITDAQAKESYIRTRAAIAADKPENAYVEAKEKAALDPLFKDHLRELGPVGAGKFLDDLPDALRSKYLSGAPLEDFSPEERAEFARNWEANTPESKKAATKVSTDVAAAIMKEARAPQRRAQARARAAAKRATAPPKPKRVSTPNAFDAAIARRVKGGMKTATAVRTDLESTPAGKEAVRKLVAGEDLTNTEGRMLARAIDKAQGIKAKANPTEITRRLTTLLRDARSGRLGYDNPLEAARNQLIEDANRGLKALGPNAHPERKAYAQAKVDERVKAINADLAGLDPTDLKAIGRVMMKHSTAMEQYQQWILGNILSGWDTGEKIAVSHPATIAAEEMRRWLFGDKSEIPGGIRAGVQGMRARGVPEAKEILKQGSTASHLSGHAWYRTEGGRIPVESRSTLHLAVLRAHGAFYQLMQTYNVERGLHLFATEDGKARGLTGKALEDHVIDVQLHPENYRDLAEKAIQFGAEETQTNKNPVSTMISKAAAISPATKVAKTILLPVANLPLNALQRTLEYQTGLLSSRAMARAYERMHPEASPEQVKAYQNKVLQRGAVGAGIAALGALGNLTGTIEEPDKKHGRYVARVNIPGTKKAIDVPAGNVGAMLDVGSSVAHDIKTRDFLHLPEQALSPLVNENPIVRAAQSVEGATSFLSSKPQDSHTANSTLGGLITEHMPLSGLTANIAAATDVARGGGVRKKGNAPFPRGAVDYPMNAIPGLRGRLALTQDKLNHNKPYPQSILHVSPQVSHDQRRKEDRDNKLADKEEWKKLIGKRR